MPVTAKLSKLFYDRLGEQVADELVNWLNSVDSASRGDLREFNEMNFARFDAKLEQRIAELRAELGTKIDRLDAQLNARMDGMVARGEFERAVAQLNATINKRYSDMLKWSFVFWISAVGILAGLLK
jgi:hypothetical protein